MRNPDEFDAFYKDARSRLLQQTYALTGDLAASRAAVRNSFVVAWHHWRKISRLEDPEAWARPHAWAHAQRRHTTRLWHRDKGMDPEIKATLDALGKLPVAQRKVLLLTQLTTVSLDAMAREVGLPRDVAERELQAGSAQFGVHRGVPTTQIRPLFEPIRELAEAAQWPRSTIVRRAGAARRRAHTGAGVLATVAALVLTGSLVTNAAGVHPTLAREQVVATAPAAEQPGQAPVEPSDAPPELTADALLTAEQVAQQAPGAGWSETSTDDNTQGDGMLLPCQRSRYADPRGSAALFRTFDAKAGKNQPRRTVIQATEVSRTERRAERTYDTTLGWYAGCLEDRAQLLTALRVRGAGDEARLLVLRSWDRPVSTMVVGVARTGRVTTTTMSRMRGAFRPDVRQSARLLAAAVDGLCPLPGSGTCAARPRLNAVDPPPAGPAPGMIAVVDLPPVTRVAQPWVGTEPRKAMVNVASTRCDETDFTGDRISHNITRSFLIPEAKLPDSFGLTETVGSLPVRQARAFVSRVRDQMAACPDKDLGTDVSRVAERSSGGRELAVWRVTTELSDQASVEYFMGILRRGTSVAQVGFIPDGRATMPPGAFVDLVERAQDRLGQMPAPD